jgi:hypothetical protein
MGGVFVSREDQALTADRISVEGKLRGSTGSPEAQLFDSALVTLTGARLLSDRSAEEQSGGERTSDERLPDAGADEHTPNDRFSAEVLLKAALASGGYSGKVSMHGADAGIILILVRSGELPGWITSKFYGEPFSLEAALGVQNGIVRISD